MCISMKRMVVTDLDGTLLNSSQLVSKKDYQTLLGLKDQGIIRAIATGRSPYSVDKVLSPDFPVDFLIFSSGAGIMKWDDKHILHSRQFLSIDVQQLVTYFINYNLDFMVHEPIPHNHCFLYHHTGNHKSTDFLHRIELYSPFCRPFIPGIEFPVGATQLIAIIPEDMILFQTISHELKKYKVIRTTSPLDGKSIWMEIFPKEVSKAYGIVWLCNLLNIEPSSILVIGNDFNDLDMLQLTKHSYVVENAPDDLSRQYKSVPSNDNSGFTTAVEEWLKGDRA